MNNKIHGPQALVVPSDERMKHLDHLLINTTPTDPNPRQVQGNLVILATTDPEAEPVEWMVVDPEDVPAQVRKPATITKMLDGHYAQPPGSRYWYVAFKEEEFDGLEVASTTA